MPVVRTGKLLISCEPVLVKPMLAFIPLLFVAMLGRAAAAFVAAAQALEGAPAAPPSRGFDAKRRRLAKLPHLVREGGVGLAQPPVVAPGASEAALGFLEAALGFPELVLEHVDDLGLRLSDPPQFFDGLWGSNSGQLFPGTVP
jgi:hypothetical protein